MRALAVISALVFTIAISCSTARKNSDLLADTAVTADKLFSKDDFDKGFGLAKQDDCFTCHFVINTENNTGPSFISVAEKYKQVTMFDVEKLAAKIRSGGNGNWSEITMTSHSNLSKNESFQLIKFVLLTKYYNEL